MALPENYDAGPFESVLEFTAFRTGEENGARDGGYVANVERIDRAGQIFARVTFAETAAPMAAAAPASPIAPAGVGSVAARFAALLGEREGRRNDVYNDSLHKLTVGIGHLVVEGDHLQLGDIIDDAQIDAFFAHDSAAAMAATRTQAAEAGINSEAFLPYLASVNFQLGTAWNKEFKETWALIMAGEYDAAAVEAARSEWAEQTPKRLHDFQAALRDLPPKPGAMV